MLSAHVLRGTHLPCRRSGELCYRPVVCRRVLRIRHTSFSVQAASLQDPSETQIETHQRQLSIVERKEKRAESQRLGKDICLVNLGRNGITENFVIGLADALAKNELVKVKVSGNGDLDVDEAQAALETAVDCVVVHKIGSSITLYRNKQLPQLSAVRDARRARAAASGLPDPEELARRKEEQAAELEAKKIAARKRKNRKRVGPGTEDKWMPPEFVHID